MNVSLTTWLVVVAAILILIFVDLVTVIFISHWPLALVFGSGKARARYMELSTLPLT